MGIRRMSWVEWSQLRILGKGVTIADMTGERSIFRVNFKEVYGDE